MGVDPDTLRRWADAGRLPSFTTPGGHRRFDRLEIERVVRSRRGAESRVPLAELGATRARLGRAYARSYRAAGDDRSRVGERFGDPDRDAFRADGRRLLGALLVYLDATSAARRASAESEAIAAVRATGHRLARGGASVEEAVQAFISARRPFLAELATIGRRRTVGGVTVTNLYDRAVALLDRLLLELLAGFREAIQPSGESSSEPPQGAVE